ncbi:MAG TPA: hypothetical protein VFR09_09310 [Alphaproteobacteria bacterium]|nr:hypothetical protein [Alphaproteobacteria bacterium]
MIKSLENVSRHDVLFLDATVPKQILIHTYNGGVIVRDKGVTLDDAADQFHLNPYSWRGGRGFALNFEKIPRIFDVYQGLNDEYPHDEVAETEAKVFHNSLPVGHYMLDNSFTLEGLAKYTDGSLVIFHDERFKEDNNGLWLPVPRASVERLKDEPIDHAPPVLMIPAQRTSVFAPGVRLQ